MNVRSVDGKRKQEQLQQAISGMGVDIWLLSETKLTKAAHFEGYFIHSWSVLQLDKGPTPRWDRMDPLDLLLP